MEKVSRLRQFSAGADGIEVGRQMSDESMHSPP